MAQLRASKICHLPLLLLLLLLLIAAGSAVGNLELGSNFTETDGNLQLQVEAVQLERAENELTAKLKRGAWKNVALAVADKAGDLLMLAKMKAQVVGHLVKLAVKLVRIFSGQGIGCGRMLQRIKEVNDKLRQVELQMQEMKLEVKLHITVDRKFAEFIKSSDSIQLAIDKFYDIFRHIDLAVTQRLLQKLLIGFTSFYESNRIDAARESLYSMATRAGSSFSTNLFRIVADVHHCSTRKLQLLMDQLVHDFNSAMQLEFTYQVIKFGEAAAQDVMMRNTRKLYEIRDNFNINWWRCLTKTRHFSQLVAKRLLKQHSTGARDRVLLLQATLQRDFHAFNWAVTFVTSHERVKGSLVNSFTMADPSNKNHQVLIAFANADDKLKCRDANFAKNRLHFTCNGACRIAASPGMLTQAKCPSQMSQQNWLAYSLSRKSRNCSSPDACGGHGLCKQHEQLQFCMCHHGYLGHLCSYKQQQQQQQQEAAEMIAALRASVGQALGALNVVDVFYEIKDVGKSIKQEIRRSGSCSRFESVMETQVMKQSSYIADIYTKFLNSNLTVHEFGLLMEQEFAQMSWHSFFYKLGTALSGKSSFSSVSTGIFVHFKRCQSYSLCSRSYSTAVAGVRKQLLLLQELVEEALVTFLNWQLQLGKINEESFERNFLYKESKLLPSQLLHHWSASSCAEVPRSPGLAGWHQRFCKTGDSFQGAELQVACDSGWEALKDKTRCEMRNGKLRWWPQPRCQEAWSSWTPWSDCSATCGGGRKTRTRCRGASNLCESVTAKCSTSDCCSLIFGADAYRCHGKCLHRSSVCDGTIDCLYGKDEQNCQFVRNGDTISLHLFRSLMTVVNCYGTSRISAFHPHCYAKFCGWTTRCGDHHTNFRIFSPDRGIDEPIRSGDVVGLMYDWDRPNWLSCTWGDRTCTTLNCPARDPHRLRHCNGERFRIFLVDYRHKCHGHNHCIGPAINHKSRIALKNYKGWLWGLHNHRIMVHNCLRDASLQRANGCPREVWQIRK